MLPQPSGEQLEIVEDIKNGYNLVISAVAGSGKTTTVCYIALNEPDKKVLCLTYNKKLALETKVRAKMKDIHNLEIRTYHSFAFTYFKLPNGIEYDQGIELAGTGRAEPRNFNFDIIIFDESQDLTQNLFNLVRQILYYNKCQIVFMGDERQCIYRYNGADHRYLSMAWQTLAPIDTWKHKTLSQSFRITRNIATFVNCALGYSRMISNKPGPKIDIYLEGFRPDKLSRWLINGLKTDKIKPDDVFVLAWSVKQGRKEKPVQKLANKLTREGIGVYRPISDDESLTNDEIKNKICFCTFHQAKGRERKIIICYSLDLFTINRYMEWKSHKNINDLPNTWYVGLTRSLHKLIIVSGIWDLPPCLKLNHMPRNILNFILPSNIDYKIRHIREMINMSNNQARATNVLDSIIDGMCGLSYDNESIEQGLNTLDTNLKEMMFKLFKYQKIQKTKLVSCFNISVSELVRHLTVNFHLNLYKKFEPLIKNDTLDTNLYTVDFEITVESDFGIENVSDLNGTAIPLIYCKRKLKMLPFSPAYIYELSKKFNIPIFTDWENTNIRDTVRILRTDELIYLWQDIRISHNNYLKIANMLEAKDSGYINRLYQIKNYNWLTRDHVSKCCYNIDEYFKDHNIISFEYPIEMTDSITTLTGRIDCLTEYDSHIYIWEFKCVKELKTEHILQLLTYTYMYYKKTNKTNLRPRLLNIRTGECYALECNFELITDVVCLLIAEKYKSEPDISDDEFMNSISQTLRTYHYDDDVQDSEPGFEGDNPDDLLAEQ